MKRVNYKVSIQGKYIHLIKTSRTPLSRHSLISHMTHSCHNLHSSLTFIMVFCHLSLSTLAVHQCLVSTMVCTHQHNRELGGLPHHKVHDEERAVALTKVC